MDICLDVIVCHLMNDTYENQDTDGHQVKVCNGGQGYLLQAGSDTRAGRMEPCTFLL